MAESGAALTGNQPQAAASGDGPAAPETKVIFDRDLAKGRVTISESLDKTKAFMSIVPSAPGEIFSPEEVFKIIRNLGICTVVKEQNISVALDLLTKKYSTTESLVIAEGRPPANGQDGSCEILFDQQSPVVDKGSVLLRISGPTAGQDGEDIYGNIIQARQGRPCSVKTADNVAINEANQLISEVYGEVVFADNILSVQKLLTLKVSSDRMKASISYIGTSKLQPERIKDELYANMITSGIDSSQIESAIQSFNTDGTPIRELVVVRGTPPKEGRDGQIQFFYTTGELPRYTEQDDGSINIHETNIVQTVREGTHLATLVPHVDPLPGKDVYGKLIPVRKVKKVALRPGKNVRASEDGLQFFAQAGGLPILDGDKISVNDLLSIKGDIDYSVGNIDFDGVVEIGGDVDDGFKVKATKNIIIRGMVSACNLESGLDIQIQGGCNGKEQATIICGRNIQTKYLNEVTVQSKGDIIVKNEIVNSNIQTLGRVIVKKGSIRGGRIGAKKGIEAFDVGSDIGVRTTLVPGEDFELIEACKGIDERIIKINEEVEGINKMIAPLLKNRELLPKLPDEQRHKIKDTITYLKGLQEEKESLNVTKSNMITASMQDALPEAVVYHYAHHGVLLKIGKSRREIASLIEGPLRLYEDRERVTVEPYGEKAESAAERGKRRL